MDPNTIRPGHGEHWRAAIGEDEGRLADVLAFPSDAPEGVKLYRRALSASLDMVQITAKRRLVSAYPEPRATALVELRPRELLLWNTGVEAWMVAEHEGAGALTLFITDLVENSTRYQRARGTITLEVGGLAYSLERAKPSAGPSRLQPAHRFDPVFLPDDYWCEADVRGAHGVGQAEVLDLAFQNGLELPVATRRPSRLGTGERAQGFLWLTARWPEEQGSSTSRSSF
jgi:hypothetical protein